MHAKPLKDLQPGDTIRVRKDKSWAPAQLVSQASAPRRYNVRMPSGRVVIRNRRHILRTREGDIFEPARIQYRCRNEVEDNETQPSGNLHTPTTTPVVTPENGNQRANHAPTPPNLQVAPPAATPVPAEIRTRSGRISRPPDRFGFK